MCTSTPSPALSGATPSGPALTGGTANTATAGAITGYGGKCVDVDAARRVNGTQVQLYTCNQTNAQQRSRSGDTLPALGMCLDVSGARTDNGTRVRLWNCSGAVAQNWTNFNGILVNPNSGKCLDARGPSFDFGAAGSNMAALTAQATDGLETALKNAYGYSDDRGVPA